MPARYDGFLEGPADAGAGQQGKLLTGFADVGDLDAGDGDVVVVRLGLVLEKQRQA